MSITRGLGSVVLLWATSALTPVAVANVNLEWRTTAKNIRVGDTVEIGLYAVSDSELNQTFDGLTVIIAWDPNVLALASQLDNGFAWVGLSDFSDDSCTDQLNFDCCCPLQDPCCDPPYSGLPENDGSARFDALHIGTPPEATPAGLLVTTFVYIAVGPASTTIVWIPESEGDHTETIVLNGPAERPTGTLGSLVLSVAACGTQGDFNVDCRVDVEIDFPEFVDCLGGPAGDPLPFTCDPADFDGDGFTDMRDVAAFQRAFTGE